MTKRCRYSDEGGRDRFLPREWRALKEATLLLKTMILGLEMADDEEAYAEYIDLTMRECLTTMMKLNLQFFAHKKVLVLQEQRGL